MTKYRYKVENRRVQIETVKVNPNPDPNSRRSKRRKNRGFTSLENSSRKHRRAISRMGHVATNTHAVKQKGYRNYHST